MKPCCIFSHIDASTAISHFGYELIKDLGKTVCNSDGTIKPFIYVWDEGGRKIIRCKNCGAIFLYQWSEFHNNYGDQDSYYDNFFLVKNLAEAELLNKKYSGFALETNYKGLTLWNSNDVWYWNKENEKESK